MSETPAIIDAMPSLAPGAGQTSDTRLVERAIRERWPIKPEWRDAVVKRLIGIVVNPKASAREQTVAARALIAADKLNVVEETAEKMGGTHNHLHLHGAADPAITGLARRLMEQHGHPDDQ